jgi:asparagine synthase (glutamine-hydrolysing)
MGQIAGAFAFDSQPVSPADRKAAAEVLAVCGGLGDLYTVGGLTILQSGREPLSRSRRGNVCAWDGRLDNKSELHALLDTGGSCSDGELALGVYEARGAAGLNLLIGDWSLAIWDSSERNLVLASDYAGVRPLYYLQSAKRMLWCSSLSRLASWSGADVLDDEYAADLLTRGLAVGRTPYRGIRPVPAGAAVRFTPRGSSVEAFWSFPLHETRYGREEDYEDELRIRFTEGVRCRLESSVAVAAELSGGLDSSSIVCAANQLIRNHAVPARQLHTFSYAHEGSTDQKYYRLVEKHCGCAGIHLDTDEHPFVSRNQVGHGAPLFWAPRLAELSRRLGELGCSTFLTGQLGDLVMGNLLDDSEQVADSFREGRFGEGLHDAFAWSRSLRLPVFSILGRAAREACWGTADGNLDTSAGIGDQQRYGESFTATFRKTMASFRSGNDVPTEAVSPTRRKRMRALRSILAARVLQCPEPLQGTGYTHPFAHRPLVEFMMTAPARVVCGPGTPRRLMRRAFAGLVPEAVLKRRSKATYNMVFRRALLPLVTDLLEQRQPIQLVERGYLESSHFLSRLDRFKNGLECNEQQLRHAILLEFWLRSRDQRDVPEPVANLVTTTWQ